MSELLWVNRKTKYVNYAICKLCESMRNEGGVTLLKIDTVHTLTGRK